MNSALENIWMQVQKPGRYTGGEVNSTVKDKSNVFIRFALCYPDLYEVGMSNLGIKILYELMNARPDTWCERVFAPASDMEAQLPLAYGTAVVLIMIILLVNLLANALRKYFEKRVKTN